MDKTDHFILYWDEELQRWAINVDASQVLTVEQVCSLIEQGLLDV